MSEIQDIDLALLPIGGIYMMGVEDAVKACWYIKPKIVVPIHYNTNSTLKADDIEFARQVMLAQYAVPKVLRAGQYIVL
jgi:L-ascorbate metabolism protein UlaG (beta-lactamase superfamily)